MMQIKQIKGYIYRKWNLFSMAFTSTSNNPVLEQGYLMCRIWCNIPTDSDWSEKYRYYSIMVYRQQDANLLGTTRDELIGQARDAQLDATDTN